ncbi:MAG: hypothetical protein WA782_09805 [Sulfitobacter sp.]|tara:strand:+ start:1553 stop:2125 length:573 start_codon:yes stop_codon:yes gene_type:complete
MPNAVDNEFSTVDILLNSDAETRGVDAFVISWVKFERQLRRINGNLIFQHSALKEKHSEDREAVRRALLAKRTANHDKFIAGIRKLSGVNVNDLIGPRYRALKRDVDRAHKYRQKIFHGQQTGNSLTREQLINSIDSIREWCALLAAGSIDTLGYDGFSKNSLQKNGRPEITQAVDKGVAAGWEKFIKDL